MPARVIVSASTRNGLCPAIVSSRSCAPLPVISMTAGNGPSPSGRVSVPAMVSGPLGYVTSSAAVGKGRLRLLRSSDIGQRAGGQRERGGLAALAVAPGDRAVLVQGAVEGGAARDVGQVERDGVAVEANVLQRERTQPLGREVEGAGGAGDAYADLQRVARGVDAAVPVAAEISRCVNSGPEHALRSSSAMSPKIVRRIGTP